MSENRPMALPCHDVLSRLAREDPEALERLRHELIESHINNAPEKLQLALRQLQFRIDGIRIRSGSALGASRKIYALMWESLMRLQDELHQFSDLTRGKVSLAAARQPPQYPPQQNAHVIPFEPRRVDAKLSGRR